MYGSALGLAGGATGAALTYLVMGPQPLLPLAPLKAMYGSALLPGAVTFLAMRKLPETHRYILYKGHSQEPEGHARGMHHQNIFLAAQHSLVACRGQYAKPLQIGTEVQHADSAIERSLQRIVRATGRPA